MANRKRQGNNPKRRISPFGCTPCEINKRLAAARYVGSAHHKSKPADYGFVPATAPRPSKSLCDYKRVIEKREAIALFRSGISRGMVSTYLNADGLPKYIWAVDADGEAYESLSTRGGDYHGYQLSASDPMRDWVLEEWQLRSRTR